MFFDEKQNWYYLKASQKQHHHNWLDVEQFRYLLLMEYLMMFDYVMRTRISLVAESADLMEKWARPPDNNNNNNIMMIIMIM